MHLSSRSDSQFRLQKQLWVLPSCAAVLCFLVLSAGGVESPDEKLPAELPTTPIPKQKLIVGVAVSPPFNIRNADDSWTGISIELWREIAKELGIDFEFRETNITGIFAGLAQGWLDVSVGPLSITERLEEVCDFTHAYFASGLAVAVPLNHLPGSARFLGAFFDVNVWWAILKVTIGLLPVMAIVAVLIWLCERRANPIQFGDGRVGRGFGAALWWSAVTMTTVGYGDVSPKTLKGRVIAVVWMFASLVLVATFTATMASVLTTDRLSHGTAVRGLDDLRQVRVGTPADSSSAQFLEANHIDYSTFARADLFAALKDGKIQAVLYAEPYLRYEIRNRYPGQFTVFPLNVDTELYAFAVREGSPLREPINRVLLRKIHEPAWESLLYRYLGSGISHAP
jgi:polar amino acid transport system substrate-binding protein